MAAAYKTLGQVNPPAASQTTLYTVPSGTQAVVSSISVCNQAASAGTFRVAVRPNGDAVAKQHYVYYDYSLSARDTKHISVGMTLDPGTVVSVFASSADFSFSAFGSEVTP